MNDRYMPPVWRTPPTLNVAERVSATSIARTLRLSLSRVAKLLGDTKIVPNRMITQRELYALISDLTPKRFGSNQIRTVLYYCNDMFIGANKVLMCHPNIVILSANEDLVVFVVMANNLPQLQIHLKRILHTNPTPGGGS